MRQRDVVIVVIFRNEAASEQREHPDLLAPERVIVGEKSGNTLLKVTVQRVELGPSPATPEHRHILVLEEMFRCTSSAQSEVKTQSPFVELLHDLSPSKLEGLRRASPNALLVVVAAQARLANAKEASQCLVFDDDVLCRCVCR